MIRRIPDVATTRSTSTYRAVVLGWLLTMSAGIAIAGGSFWIDTRDTGREHTRLLKEQGISLDKLGKQATDLDKLTNKLNQALDTVGQSNGVVAEKMGQMQRQIDELEIRVTAIQKKR